MSIDKINISETIAKIEKGLHDDSRIPSEFKTLVELLLLVVKLLVKSRGLNNSNSSVPPSQDPNREKYFHSIDHKILKNLLRRLFADRNLLILLDQIIDHQIPGDSPGRGLPIGNLTSQYFANLYLGELDHFLKDRCGVRYYLRYMDDFLIFHLSKGELQRLLPTLSRFLGENLNLNLKARVTRLA